MKIVSLSVLLLLAGCAPAAEVFRGPTSDCSGEAAGVHNGGEAMLRLERVGEPSAVFGWRHLGMGDDFFFSFAVEIVEEGERLTASGHEENNGDPWPFTVSLTRDEAGASGTWERLDAFDNLDVRCDIELAAQ